MNGICLLLGHSKELMRKVSANINEYKCKRCGDEIAELTAPSGVVSKPLTPELKTMHDTLHKMNNTSLEDLLSELGLSSVKVNKQES